MLEGGPDTPKLSAVLILFKVAANRKCRKRALGLRHGGIETGPGSGGVVGERALLGLREDGRFPAHRLGCHALPWASWGGWLCNVLLELAERTGGSRPLILPSASPQQHYIQVVPVLLRQLPTKG